MCKYIEFESRLLPHRNNAETTLLLYEHCKKLAVINPVEVKDPEPEPVVEEPLVVLKKSSKDKGMKE